MPDTDSSKIIGGEFCKASIGPQLLPREGQHLTQHERERLWRIFQEIGLCWRDLHSKATDSKNLKSSWLEFVEAKTTCEPTYIAEYSNAVSVVDELIEMYGEAEAFRKLFLENGIPAGPPTTRLAHAKRYVVDEFIRVNVVASGFRNFGGKNYRGYLGGSRYNLRAKVREYEPSTVEKKP